MGRDEINSAVQDLLDLVGALPEKYRTVLWTCSSMAVVKKQIQGLHQFKPERRFLGRIEHFLDILEPFFKRVDLLSQVDTLHFVVIWGCLRILIQLSHYIMILLVLLGVHKRWLTCKAHHPIREVFR